MAKTSDYNDDILIEAVEKYSEQHTSGKIKATKACRVGTAEYNRFGKCKGLSLFERNNL